MVYDGVVVVAFMGGGQTQCDGTGPDAEGQDGGSEQVPGLGVGDGVAHERDGLLLELVGLAAE